MNTLTKEGRAKVVLHEKEYTFGNGDYVSGTVLLKVVIMESYIDTNATTRHIRQHLSQLHEYILTVDSDIEIFNLYVNGLINSLAARGQSTQDLLANLFKGYKAATDDVFVKYMRWHRWVTRRASGNATLPGAIALERGFLSRPLRSRPHKWQSGKLKAGLFEPLP
jgi:hypothetical protein